MTDSKNQEEFKKVSEIQQRLDILIEHVESRKEALEEEIQEHLHESLANARDSIERIQENIAPKVEKAIHAKMEEIDRKMRRLNEDGLESVREELQKATPEISQRILEDLDNNDNFNKEDNLELYNFLMNIVIDKNGHNIYLERIESAGLNIVGKSKDKNLVEVVELDEHPWYVGCQFHPEFISRPNRPHPLFSAFVKASAKTKPSPG